MSRLNRKGPSMTSWCLPWTQDVLAPEPWICYLGPKQNLRHQVPQWQRLCSIHLCASLPLLSLHPDLVQCLPWSRPHQRTCSCLHVSVPIMDVVCPLSHSVSTSPSCGNSPHFHLEIHASPVFSQCGSRGDDSTPGSLCNVIQATKRDHCIPH